MNDSIEGQTYKFKFDCNKIKIECVRKSHISRTGEYFEYVWVGKNVPLNFPTVKLMVILHKFDFNKKKK